MIGEKRPLSALMRVAGHLTTGHDRVAARFSSPSQDGELDFDPQHLRRQDPTSPPKFTVSARFGRPQNFVTPRHARLSNAQSPFESFHFLRGLDLALRPEGTFHSLDANPLFLQALRMPEREIPRRQDVP